MMRVEDIKENWDSLSPEDQKIFLIHLKHNPQDKEDLFASAENGDMKALAIILAYTRFGVLYTALPTITND